MEKAKCKQGIEYNCPYLENCESKFGAIDSCSLEANSLFILSRGLTENNKTWHYENRLYSCLPNKFPKGKTFFGEEVLK